MAKNNKSLLEFTNSDCVLAILRIVAGVFFAGAGINKLIEGMTGFMFGVGIVEIVVGVLLAVGLFTRLAAVVGGIIMIGALITVHFAGWNFAIYGNGSEKAFLYLVTFIVFFTKGAGKWSLEKVIFKKEIF
jgi:putative oxidoreductase